MTRDERFRRTHLRAFESGLVDPRLVVERWLSDAQDLWMLLGDGGRDYDCQDAFDAVATQGRLARVDAELLSILGGVELLQWLRNLLASESAGAIVELALRVPDIGGWLEQAEELSEACETGTDFVLRADLAQTLLTDLDDAQLVELAGRQCGVADNSLAGELDHAMRWLVERPETFLAASIWIQSVAFTLRSDLAASDPELALTAEKFAVLLDEIEETQEELLMSELPALHETVAAGLVRAEDSTAGEAAELWPAPSRRAASDTEDVVYRLDHWRDLPKASSLAAQTPLKPLFGPRLRWKSPDGAWQASLRMRQSLDASGATVVTLTFESVAGHPSPSVEIVDQTLALGGAESRIARRDVEGQETICASIILERMLACSDEFLVLRVAGQLWPAAP